MKSLGREGAQLDHIQLIDPTLGLEVVAKELPIRYVLRAALQRLGEEQGVVEGPMRGAGVRFDWTIIARVAETFHLIIYKIII